MRKRNRTLQTIATIEDVDDFMETVELRGPIELPTDEELVCTGDEVREECEILGGVYDSRFE